MKYFKLLLIFFIVVLYSCTNNELDYDDFYKTLSIESYTVAKGELTGGGKEGIDLCDLVIDNKAGWENLISQMDKVNFESKTFKETSIDFSKFMIIAVFDDLKKSTGFNIEIIDVINSENGLEVFVKHSKPSENASFAFMQPYHIMKLPKTSDAVTFFHE